MSISFIEHRVCFGVTFESILNKKRSFIRVFGIDFEAGNAQETEKNNKQVARSDNNNNGTMNKINSNILLSIQSVGVGVRASSLSPSPLGSFFISKMFFHVVRRFDYNLRFVPSAHLTTPLLNNVCTEQYIMFRW